MGGVPILSAISAPSTLAVELASAAELALIGFLRGDPTVIYSRPRPGQAAKKFWMPLSISWMPMVAISRPPILVAIFIALSEIESF